MPGFFRKFILFSTLHIFWEKMVSSVDRNPVSSVHNGPSKLQKVIPSLIARHIMLKSSTLAGGSCENYLE